MDTLKIRTPEGVEFALPLAGPVSRMLAYALDLLVVMTIGTVARQILAPLGFFGKDFSDAIRILAYFVISLVYMMLAEWLWRGQTVGKRLLRLRVAVSSATAGAWPTTSTRRRQWPAWRTLCRCLRSQ